MSSIIYGIHPVREALRSSGLRFERVLIGPRPPSPSLQSILDLVRKKQIPVVFTDQEALGRMAGGGVHQNIVGIVEETPYAGLEELLARAKREEAKALLLVLDGIQDPQNLGSLIRTALGCGAQGIIIPKDRAAGITPAVIKASAGAAAHLPVARVVNIAMTVERLKREGLWVYGASSEGKDSICNLDFNTDVAIVIGAEGKGIRPLVKKRCDRLFSIPMKGPVSSFNASVSAGMIFYEIMRQRTLRDQKENIVSR